MRNTSKKIPRMLAELLASHGVRDVVLSPGSRNAPLIIALERNSKLDTHVVIDERSAAFIALGMSVAENYNPVAITCTSGSAPLNYAPAIAEAYYRHVPLIAITADRPEPWIDQDDCQTIIQTDIYHNYIKASFDIPAENDSADSIWMSNRRINEALNIANTEPKGPVHINIRLEEPLGEICDVNTLSERTFNIKTPKIGSYPETFNNIIPKDKKILILCGFMPKSPYNKRLSELAARGNIVVLHEAQSNLNNLSQLIGNIDATMSCIDSSDDDVVPDIVISFGGSVISRKIKEFLRKHSIRHICFGPRATTADCFRQLAFRIDMPQEAALNSLADFITHIPTQPDTQYKIKWQSASIRASKKADAFAKNAVWSDFKAMQYIISNIPPQTNLHVSNGTSIRYVQLFDYTNIANIECNRGVSGIDGCLSTAIGAAVRSTLPTILITGDMSMQYDIGALATNFIPSNFKIIMLNNGGGGIFRCINSTANLDELEKCFIANVKLPLQKLSEAYGFSYYCAKDLDSLAGAFHSFLSNNSSPAILEIITDGKISADVLKEFYITKI